MLWMMFIGISIIVGGIFLYNSFADQKLDHKWNLVGYQYRWNDDYIERRGFISEDECVDFGNEWLNSQETDEALFTCSTGCRPYQDTFLEVCNEVCEYGQKGFIQCRY